MFLSPYVEGVLFSIKVTRKGYIFVKSVYKTGSFESKPGKGFNPWGWASPCKIL